MSKLQNYTTDIVTGLDDMLCRRIHTVELTPKLPQMLREHSCQRVTEFGQFIKEHVGTAVTISGNYNLTFTDPRTTFSVSTVFTTQWTSQLHKDYEFGIILQRADDPLLPTIEPQSSTLWPEVQEVVQQCWKWQAQAAVMRGVVTSFIAACRGPAQLAKTWPELYQMCLRHRWLTTLAMTDVRKELIGSSTRIVRPQWRTVMTAINQWYTEAVMLDSTKHYGLEHRLIRAAELPGLEGKPWK